MAKPVVLVVQPIIAALSPITGVPERVGQAIGEIFKRQLLAGELERQGKAVRSPRREEGRKFVRIVRGPGLRRGIGRQRGPEDRADCQHRSNPDQNVQRRLLPADQLQG